MFFAPTIFYFDANLISGKHYLTVGKQSTKLGSRHPIIILSFVSKPNCS